MQMKFSLAVFCLTIASFLHADTVIKDTIFAETSKEPSTMYTTFEIRYNGKTGNIVSQKINNLYRTLDNSIKKNNLECKKRSIQIVPQYQHNKQTRTNDLQHYAGFGSYSCHFNDIESFNNLFESLPQEEFIYQWGNIQWVLNTEEKHEFEQIARTDILEKAKQLEKHYAKLLNTACFIKEVDIQQHGHVPMLAKANAMNATLDGSTKMEMVAPSKENIVSSLQARVEIYCKITEPKP